MRARILGALVVLFAFAAMGAQQWPAGSGGAGNPFFRVEWAMDGGVDWDGGGTGVDINNTCMIAGGFGAETTAGNFVPLTRTVGLTSTTPKTSIYLPNGEHTVREFCVHNLWGGAFQAGSSIEFTVEKLIPQGGTGQTVTQEFSTVMDATNDLPDENLGTCVTPDIVVEAGGQIRVCVLTGDAVDNNPPSGGRSRMTAIALVERTAAP